MGDTIRHAFRITHINNIAHIVKDGIVRANSPKAYSDYVAIGDVSIINIRKQTPLKDGTLLGDCVPFYFGFRSPMLLKIQTGYDGLNKIDAENIVYIVLRIDTLINHNIKCSFTDGHALAKVSKFYTAKDLVNINNILRKEDIFARQWKTETDQDLQRRKEAELLIKEDLPYNLISGFVVYNSKAKQRLLSLGIPENKIIVKPEYYY